MKTPAGLSRPDWLHAVMLWAGAVAVFGASATRLGFYYDDGRWMNDLGSIDLSGLLTSMVTYIPGRPLFVLWQYLFLRVTGDPAAHLPALHLIQSALDGLVVVCFFLLLRLLRLPAHVALVAAGLFAFWPIHGETHFWNPSVGGSIASTLFVLLFSMTSVLLVRDQSPKLWLWLLDGAAFACGVFTYDQVFFVLIGIVVLRMRRKFSLAYLPYLAAGALVVWLKTATGAGGPALLPAALWGNIRATVSWTVGGMWLRHVTPLYERNAPSDWLLALAVAALLTGLAVRLLLRASPREPDGPDLRRILDLALFFYVAAYLPVWFWFLSPRLHYLPSIGLFAGVAAGLTWILGKAPARGGRAAVLVIAGGGIFLFAAASRGESRAWEQAFTTKKELFSALKADLAGKDVLVLENFPNNLGPAYLIYPQDANFGPSLFYRGSGLPGPRFAGDISAVPAPGGLFLRTHTYFHGPEDFRYYPTDNYLLVRFAGWKEGSLRYARHSLPAAPYQVVSSHVTPTEGPFHVHEVSIRRDGEDTLARLRLRAELLPRAYLVTVLSFLHGEDFHRWGYLVEGHMAGVVPVLLSDSDQDPRSGCYEWDLALRLHAFPETEEVRFDFYRAFSDEPPARLGRAEATLTP